MTPKLALRRAARTAGSPFLRLLDRRFLRIESAVATRADALQWHLDRRFDAFERRLFTDVVTAGQFFTNQERATQEIRATLSALATRDPCMDHGGPALAEAAFVLGALAELSMDSRVAIVVAPWSSQGTLVASVLRAAGFDPIALVPDAAANAESASIHAIVVLANLSRTDPSASGEAAMLARCRELLAPNGVLVRTTPVKRAQPDGPAEPNEPTAIPGGWNVTDVRWAVGTNDTDWTTTANEPDTAAWACGQQGVIMLRAHPAV